MALADNLAGYWSWDAGSGAQVLDLSPNLRNGVLVGGSYATGKVGPFGYRPSAAGDATVFPGDGMGLNQQAPLFSLQVWVNVDKAFSAMWGARHDLFNKEVAGVSGYSLFVTAAGILTARAYDVASSEYATTFAEVATSGWLHYVVSFGGDTGYLRLYRNGVQVGQQLISGTLYRDAATDIVVGQGVEGVIDDVAIWTRSLSAAEVLALYNSGNGLRVQPASGFSAGIQEGRSTPQSATFQANAIPTPPSPLVLGVIPFGGVGGITSSGQQSGQYTAGSAGFVSTPLPFADPLPVITSATVTSAHLASFSGLLGFTTAGWVSYWWEVEMLDGSTYIRFSESLHVDLSTTRIPVTTSFTLPENTGLDGRRLRLVCQREAQPPQTWASPWVTLSGADWNFITYVPPPVDEFAWHGPYTIQNLINDSIQTVLAHNGEEIPVILAPFGRIQIQQSNVTNHLRQLERWNRVEVYGGNVRINL